MCESVLLMVVYLVGVAYKIWVYLLTKELTNQLLHQHDVYWGVSCFLCIQ